jgi:nucleoside-diphosphate-sugar epimerase
MNLVGKRVLITGGAGFIGSNLAKTLISEGCFVRIVDSFRRGDIRNLDGIRYGSNTEIFDFDLTNPNLAKEACKDVQIVFDLAADVFGVNGLFKNPGSLISNNVRISLNVAEACVSSGVEHLVFASSSCVYGYPNAKIPHEEHDRGLPSTFYGWSKLFGEVIYTAFSEESGLKYSVARIFNAFGPRESLHYPHVIPDFIMKAKACKEGSRDFEIIGDGLQTRSFIYIDDLVTGLIRLAEHKPLKEAINLGSSECIKMVDLAHLIIELFGLKPKDINFIYAQAHPNDIRKRSADCHKAYLLLGWEPKISLRKGLERTVQYMNQIQVLV